MVKVALAIAPRIQDDFGYTPAGASLVKAAIVKAGHECKIFDFTILKLCLCFLLSYVASKRQNSRSQIDYEFGGYSALMNCV